MGAAEPKPVRGLHAGRLHAGRNRALLARHQAGASVAALAAEHGVSPGRIQRLLGEERRAQAMQRQFDELRRTVHAERNGDADD